MIITLIASKTLILISKDIDCLSSSVKPCPYSIFICLEIVVLPLSLVPVKGKTKNIKIQIK